MQPYLFFENVSDTRLPFPFCITHASEISQEDFYKDRNIDLASITELFSNNKREVISVKTDGNLELYKVKNLLPTNLPEEYKGVFPENLFFHMHRCLEITYISEGTIIYITNSEVFRLEKGELIIFNSNTPHTWASAQKDGSIAATTFFFYPSLLELKHFNNDEMVEISKFSSASNGAYLYKKDNPITERMANILLECENEYEKQEFGYHMLIRTSLINIITLLIREKTNHKQNFNVKTYPKSMEKALGYINENFCNKISLNEAAELSYMTPNYFSAYFKKYMGATFVKYVNYLRITKSYEMLAFTDKKISEIAAECGFGALSNFNNMFYNTYKMSPNQFRKQSENKES